MGSPTSLTDPSALLVADASTVINLNATGCAKHIIRALPNRLVIVDVIQAELEAGRQRGRQDSDLLSQLVSSGLVHIVKLGDVGAEHFESLVVGPAVSTLDDGEAATIAYAIEQHGIAVIDERKANRLCAQNFPALRLCCTVDILTHPAVEASLGIDNLADAVFKALYHGRMRVFPNHVEWVVSLIGTHQAAACASLPRSARRE